MNIKRCLTVLLAAVMLITLLPVAALAEKIDYAVAEAAAMRKLDDTWSALDKAEAEALAGGLDKNATIKAVYEAALNLELVDTDGFSDFDENGFFFSVGGMLCSYDYKLRNEIIFENAEAEPEVIDVKGNSSNGAQNQNVLLVAPYYGYDGSFTNQYKREAQSIADATGGEYTLIEGHNATGPAIAAAFPNNGVVIFDSHGTQSGTSSYLCLTTNSGITSTDYSNGWAVSAGSAAYIDGRYIENHVTSELPNTFVWMAICEGMMRQGRGTTGTALLNAGAGAVYGYSQSVTFSGDYLYEETFWNAMKDGETIADAFELMVNTHGEYDPRGDSYPAYPIVMSDVDPFPANPDSAQTVYCPWTLYGTVEPVAITSFSLDSQSAELYRGQSATVNFAAVPENANTYELVWTSSDPAVATVAGTNRRATITAVNPGSAVITCRVMVDGQQFGSADVRVSVLPGSAVDAALNVEGGTLAFDNVGEYPFVAADVGGRFCAESSNQGVNSSTSSVSLSVDMLEGDTLTFDWYVSSEGTYDKFEFRVNGQNVQTLSGTNGTWAEYTYTAQAEGSYVFEWKYSKDYSQSTGDDTAYLDNVALHTSAAGELGDVNGDGTASVADALLILRYSLGSAQFDAEQLLLADLNNDGAVNSIDALLVMRMSLGTI